MPDANRLDLGTGDVARAALDGPQGLVWAAIRRLGLTGDEGYEIAPTPYGGLYLDVWVPGGPARSFEVDAGRLRELIDTGDEVALDAAVGDLVSRARAAIDEVMAAWPVEEVAMTDEDRDNTFQDLVHPVPYTPSFVVADSLDDLRGPADGEVVLPNRLLWNRSRPFDLSDEKRLRSMLRIILREARSQEDLATYVDRDSLVRHWASLGLPTYIQDAWVARFPELTSRDHCPSTAPGKGGSDDR